MLIIRPLSAQVAVLERPVFGVLGGESLYSTFHHNLPFTLTAQDALRRRSLPGMAQCWSSGTSYDNFPKSADFACKQLLRALYYDVCICPWCHFHRCARALLL
jgi:hypothetical protein